MKRRLFLTKSAAAIGALLSTRLFAQTNGHNDHQMPMSGMDHGAMNMDGGAMAMDHGAIDMSAIKEYQLGNRTLTSVDLTNIANADKNLLAPSVVPKNASLPELVKLPNLSQEANTFKATLHAKPVEVELVKGTKTDFWAYNDHIPGQTIEVFEGDAVEITLKNSLPQATTIHWHGLLVPPSEDGNPQDEVKSGDMRVYKFTIPMGTAGTYWYHPHGHNTVAEQAYRGLAGVFIVKSKTDPFAHLNQQNWLISDLKLNDDGTIAENSMNDWMNGREGQFVLINGALEPNITIDSATRVRVWNACSGRYLNLALKTADIYVIATDGGFIERAQLVESLLLSPGERFELIIVPKIEGNQPLEALAYDRGKMGEVLPETTKILANVSMKKSVLPTFPEKIRTLPELGKTVVYKSLEYSEIMENNRLLFLVNGKIHDMERVDMVSKINEVEEWTIFNNSHMDHNFHMHGTQFQIIEFDHKGQKSKPIINGLKDTVNLRPYEKVRLKMVQEHKGLRMYHCHILEHETLGMMGQLQIV